MGCNDLRIAEYTPVQMLDGIRVLDLASLAAAPLVATYLGEFGADVIKVEEPRHGDPIRSWGNQRDGVGLMWKSLSRNKRSITLDLRCAEGQALVKRGTVDLSLLDEKVEALCTKLLYTFPECMTKTVEELRKPKLIAWNANKENSRDWLALNMMTEARAGFRAFNEGTRETGREVDFVALRRALAANTPWSDDLTDSIQPRARS